MESPVVSIIVVSFNTRDMTLECLRSVQRETTVPYELIVIDNASEDGSAEAIAAEFPGVSLTASQQNFGFAVANNEAAKAATGTYLLLLNPDTVLLDRAVDRIVEFAEATPDARIWGGRTLFADHELNPASCWAKMTLWNVFCRTSGLASIFSKSEFFNSEGYGDWDRSTVREVDIVTGCFLLMRANDWSELGGFDEAFFMYGEEADLCLRATKYLDARPLLSPDATLIHYGGASERVRSDKMVRLLRAKVELLKRHMRPLEQWISRRLVEIWPFSRWIAFGLAETLGISAPGTSRVWGDVWRRRTEWIDGF